MSKMSDAHRRGLVGGTDRDKAQIYEHLRSKDKNELVDELAVLIEKEAAGEFNLELVRAYLVVLREKNPLPAAVHPEDTLATFHEKHDLFLREQAQAVHQKRRIFSSLASKIVAAVLAVSIFGSVFAHACGIDVFGFFARWSSEIFHFADDESVYATIGKYPLVEGESETYSTLQDALDAFGVTALMAPRAVPERLGAPVVTAERKAEGICIFASYEQGKDFLIIRFNASDGTNDRSVEKDASGTLSYTRGGVLHYLLDDHGVEKANWKNGVFECYMTGNVTETEMKEIIDSIYEGM